MKKPCSECGAEFTAPAGHTKYCENHRGSNNALAKARQARWAATDSGKASRNNTREKYLASENAKVVARANAKRNRRTPRAKATALRNRKTEKGKASEAARHRRYFSTEKGQLTLRRSSLKIRAQGYKQEFRQEEYVEVCIWLRGQICSWCGVQAEQLDHALPLAMAFLFGYDDAAQRWNWNPMCKCCHRIKTNMDVSDIGRLKRER